jgi:hypothetical protein
MVSERGADPEGIYVSTLGPSGIDWGTWDEGECPKCKSRIVGSVKAEICSNEECDYAVIYP